VRRFTELYFDLDASNRSGDKQAALESYFKTVPAEDAAWALAFFSGRGVAPKRPVSSSNLRAWAAEHAALPLWLVETCHAEVGDLSETLSLLLPDRGRATEEPLHLFVRRLVDLHGTGPEEQKRRLIEIWDSLDQYQKLVFHKMLGGSFRVGVQRRMLVKALAAASAVDPAVIEHRLGGTYKPTPQAFHAIVRPDAPGTSGPSADPARPYPFCLAHPLEQPAETLGDITDWHLEWKWDGIRAQIIRRVDTTMIWSRGEELLNDAFPELVAMARALPEGTVIDGEIVAWDPARSMVRTFQALQTRINRKRRDLLLFEDAPVRVIAYDLLEVGGEDARGMPLEARRDALAALVRSADQPLLTLSESVNAGTWEQAAAARATSRERGVEGLMLKRAGSPYGVGRARGDWWKWKIDPYSVDAVMIYAQQGSGRRAGLFTDYTFAVWEGTDLTPVAKAYSGLTAEEIEEVNVWVRRHTLEARGPVRMVEPLLVFEIAFEGIAESPRHRSGVSLRFPRIARWRKDKTAEQADTLESLKRLLNTPNG
jgi:DNA ligase-1